MKPLIVATPVIVLALGLVALSFADYPRDQNTVQGVIESIVYTSPGPDEAWFQTFNEWGEPDKLVKMTYEREAHWTLIVRTDDDVLEVEMDESPWSRKLHVGKPVALRSAIGVDSGWRVGWEVDPYEGED